MQEEERNIDELLNECCWIKNHSIKYQTGEYKTFDVKNTPIVSLDILKNDENENNENDDNISEDDNISDDYISEDDEISVDNAITDNNNLIFMMSNSHYEDDNSYMGDGSVSTNSNMSFCNRESKLYKFEWIKDNEGYFYDDLIVKPNYRAIMTIIYTINFWEINEHYPIEFYIHIFSLPYRKINKLVHILKNYNINTKIYKILECINLYENKLYFIGYIGNIEFFNYIKDNYDISTVNMHYIFSGSYENENQEFTKYLFNTIVNYNFDMFQYHIKCETVKYLINTKDIKQYYHCILESYISNGNLEGVKLMIDNGAIITNNVLLSVLYNYYKYEEIILYIIEKSINIDIKKLINNDTIDNLIKYVIKDDINIYLEEILKNISTGSTCTIKNVINSINENYIDIGNTNLMIIAIKNFYISVVQALLHKGCKVTDEMMALTSNKKIIKLLNRYKK